MSRIVFVSLIALMASIANANAESRAIVAPKGITPNAFASACTNSGGAAVSEGPGHIACNGASSGDYDCQIGDDGKLEICNQSTPGRRRGKLAEVLGVAPTGTGGTTVTSGGNDSHNGNDDHGNGADASASGGNDAGPSSANTGSGGSIN